MKKNSNKHAIKRFKERYDFVMTEAELNQISHEIGELKHSLVHWDENNTSVFKIQWKGIECYAVYAYSKASVITFLSLDMIIKNGY